MENIDYIQLLPATKVMTHVHLGNYRNSQDISFLKRNDITKVISFYRSYDYTEYIDIDYHFVSLNDIQQIIDLINTYLRNNINILIHCKRGNQESSTILACYFIWKNKMSLYNALGLTKRLRLINLGMDKNQFDIIKQWHTKIIGQHK
jgi:protein-tyrosine phosphatase